VLIAVKHLQDGAGPLGDILESSNNLRPIEKVEAGWLFRSVSDPTTDVTIVLLLGRTEPHILLINCFTYVLPLTLLDLPTTSEEPHLDYFVMPKPPACLIQ
jgi:hypothetical protein